MIFSRLYTPLFAVFILGFFALPSSVLVAAEKSPAKADIKMLYTLDQVIQMANKEVNLHGRGMVAIPADNVKPLVDELQKKRLRLECDRCGITNLVMSNELDLASNLFQIESHERAGDEASEAAQNLASQTDAYATKMQRDAKLAIFEAKLNAFRIERWIENNASDALERLEDETYGRKRAAMDELLAIWLDPNDMPMSKHLVHVDGEPQFESAGVPKVLESTDEIPATDIIRFGLVMDKVDEAGKVIEEPTGFKAFLENTGIDAFRDMRPTSAETLFLEELQELLGARNSYH